MPRRSNGVRFDSSRERWVAELWLRDSRGKRVARRRFAATEREARRLRLELVNRYRFTLNPGDGSQSVGAFLEDWLDGVARHRVRPSTFNSYAGIVRHHLIPVLGRYRLDRLAPQHVQDLLGSRLADGLSPRRVSYIRAVLRSALAQAQLWGLVDRNVATLVEPPRVRCDRVDALTPDHARSVLAAVRGDRMEALYVAALGGGMRQGELLGLHWRDVDLDRGSVTVRWTLQRLNGEWDLSEPKTERSRRTVALPEFAVEALRNHRLRQLEERLRAGDAWDDRGLIFTTERGAPLHATNVTKRFQQLLAAAGLPRMRFHDLRHGAATLMLSQGVSPRVIQETLGHANYSTTMDFYSHVAQELQEDAAGKLNAALAP